MTTEITSPTRRHILSSINPDRARLSPPPNDPQVAPPSEPSQPPGEAAEPVRESRSPVADPERKARNGRSSKFRFKTKSSHSHRSSRHRERERDRHHDDDRDGDRDGDAGEGHRADEREGHRERDDGEPRHHRRRRHHHRRHGRRRSRTRSPTPPNPYEPPPLDPEAAFRASLFDAMADDEGAAYWEGVYGQPLHVYAHEREGGGGGGPQGELERMTDDEYAAHVRQRMWEKTHQGLLEARARREEEKRARDDRAAEARRLTREMEESLRRGEARRRRRGWRARYDDYARRWEAWDGRLEEMGWPVSSGRREDVEPDAVRDFFVNGLDPVEMGEKDFLAKLKEERVRWHPDKIQQRLGDKFDDAVQRDVTAVFQIIDKLWSDIRAKAKT